MSAVPRTFGNDLAQPRAAAGALPASRSPAVAAAPDPPISACIITHQEEDHIVECIRSLSFCDEILVVDAHSTDRTRELAADCGARVIVRDWHGYRSQKEFAIRAACHDWVLCLDADERVSAPLYEEIRALRRSGFAPYSGFRVCRKLQYFGRFLRHGTAYPDRLVRLFDRRRGGWRGNEIHENTRIEERIRNLTGYLEHYSYRNLSDQMERLQLYACLMADAMHANGRRAPLLRVFLNPLWRFVSGYVLRLGFLDGWRGLVFALVEANYVRRKYLQLYMMGKAPERCRPS